MKIPFAPRFPTAGVFMDEATAFLQSLGKDTTTLAEVQACSSALELGNRTLTILAAVNIAEDVAKAPKGRDMATTILRSAATSIPDSLRRILEAIASA